MKHTAQIALAMLLMMIAAGCHKDTKEARLQALDEAYKSGVFTKEEYDAKKQAILGSPPAAPTPPATAPAEPAAASPAPAGAVEPAPANPPVAAPAQTPAAPPPVPAQAVPPPSPAPAPPAVRATPPASPPSAPAAEPAEPEPAPLAGCQDSESRAGGPSGVQERFFPASEDAVRQAAIRAFTNLDFAIHASTAHEMEAGKRRHLSAVVGAGGERVILHFATVHKGGQAGTRVTGETKKSITGRLAQKSWTTAVLAQIACNLRAAR